MKTSLCVQNGNVVTSNYRRHLKTHLNTAETKALQNASSSSQSDNQSVNSTIESSENMNEIEEDPTSPELLNENSEVVLPISSDPISIPSTSKPQKKRRIDQREKSLEMIWDPNLESVNPEPVAKTSSKAVKIVSCAIILLNVCFKKNCFQCLLQKQERVEKAVAKRLRKKKN